MFLAVKSNSPGSAPRYDSGSVSCKNTSKGEF